MIEQKILAILKDKLSCSDELFDKKYWDAPLTWEPFNFSAIQLMYLFLELEKALDIRIPEQELHDYGFSTIRKIIAIVGNVT